MKLSNTATNELNSYSVFKVQIQCIWNVFSMFYVFVGKVTTLLKWKYNFLFQQVVQKH